MYKVFLYFYRHRWLATLVLVMLLALSVPGLKKVQVKLNIKRVLESTKSKRAGEHVIKNARVIIVRIQAKQASILDNNYLEPLSKLIQNIQKQNIKTKVESILTIKTLENTDEGLTLEPLFKSNDYSNINTSDLKDRMLGSKLILDTFVSKNLKTTTLIIKYYPKNIKQMNDQYSYIESILNRWNPYFKSISIMSPAKPQVLMFKSLKSHAPILFGISILLLLSFFSLMTKNVNASIIALLIISVNLALSFSIMGFMGWPINVMSAVLPFLILVLGGTESVHLMCTYLKGLVKYEHDHSQAIKFMVDKVYFSSILTAGTTTLGFYSFAITKSLALQEFAFAGGTAMLVCGIVTLFFMPYFLSLFPLSVKTKVDHVSKTKFNLSDSIVNFLVNKSRLLLCMVIVLFVGCLYLDLRVKSSMDMFGMFRSHHQFSKDLASFRNDFGGMNFMQVTIKAPEVDDFVRSKDLKDLSLFSRSIRESNGISSVFSFADVIKNINQKLNDNQKKFRRVPDSDDAIEQITSLLDMDQLSGLMNEDFDQATLKVRFKFFTTDQVQALERHIREVFSQQFGKGYSIKIYHRLQPNIHALSTLVKEGGLSILVCMLTIFLLFCIQFNSVLSGFIAIFSNTIPVMMLLAFMSLMHIPLNPISMSALIIVLSVGVDGTIHFFTKFSYMAMHSNSNKSALSKTLHFELLPITTSTAAVFVSMLVLSFSSVNIMHTLGLLISMGILFAYIADFLVNSVLLSKFRVINSLDILAFRYNSELLQSAPIFKGFTKSQIKKAVLLSEVRHLQSGEQLIKQGEPGNSMYLVLEGELDVCRDSVSIARLKPGNVVGEMGYFSDVKRTADVFSDGDVSLVVFNEKAQRHSMRFHRKMYLKLIRNALTIVLKRLSVH